MSHKERDAPAAAPESAAGYQVQFEEGGNVFTAGPEEALLHAAARAGIELPSSCRNGTCRTCMCQLVRGEVSYRIRWPGLLPEEKAAGWILPCIAYAQSDLVLRRDRPRIDWRHQRDQ